MHGLKSASTTASHISCMQVPQLRAELAIRGMDRSGTKGVLRARLEDAKPVNPLTHVSTLGITDVRNLLKARDLDTSGAKRILRARLEDALLEDITRATEEAASTRAIEEAASNPTMHGLKSASTTASHISCMQVAELQAELAIRDLDRSGTTGALRARLRDALLYSAPKPVNPLTHVSTLGITDVRTLLETRDLDTSGTKGVLCARLEDALLEDIACAIEEAASTPAPFAFGDFMLDGERLNIEAMRRAGLLWDPVYDGITAENGVIKYPTTKVVPFDDGFSE